MKHTERIEEIARIGQGIVTASQVSAAGIPRHVLKTMVDSGALSQLERGIYLLEGYWEE